MEEKAGVFGKNRINEKNENNIKIEKINSD
jgi:hypothetical protein